MGLKPQSGTGKKKEDVGLKGTQAFHIVAQGVKNRTSIHGDVGLIPGLDWWVKGLKLP